MSSLRTTQSGIHYVVLGYPVRDAAQQVIGALGFSVNLQAIQDSLAALPVPDGSVVTVADRDGRILASREEPGRYVGQLLPPEMRRRATRATRSSAPASTACAACTGRRAWTTVRGW